MVKTGIGNNFSVGKMTTGIKIHNVGVFWKKKEKLYFACNLLFIFFTFWYISETYYNNSGISSLEKRILNKRKITNESQEISYHILCNFGLSGHISVLKCVSILQTGTWPEGAIALSWLICMVSIMEQIAHSTCWGVTWQDIRTFNGTCLAPGD